MKEAVCICYFLSHMQSGFSTCVHLSAYVCLLLSVCLCVSACICAPVWGRGTPLFSLVHLLPPLFPFLLFPFFHWHYLFSAFVHLVLFSLVLCVPSVL